MVLVISLFLVCLPLGVVYKSLMHPLPMSFPATHYEPLGQSHKLPGLSTHHLSAANTN